MAVLKCGASGSTGAEIVNQINHNTVVAEAFNGGFHGIKGSALAVPDTYNASDLTLDVLGLIGGRYLIGYAFEADFKAHRDKELLFQLTGDQAGAEFGETISTGRAIGLKSRYYQYYEDLPAGDFSFGIHFKDASGGNDFTINFIDLMLTYVGPTPVPAP